jgi:hypothetical protein
MVGRAVNDHPDEGPVTVRADYVAKWLVAIGYGFDFVSTVPLPEPLRRPLAEAWWESEKDLTPEDYYDTLAEEGAW